ncbi:hypothetical protein LTR15_009701 [Elasticomyces elasticus]|nr:hypothetical protein LTR15_009701 [Elasticomyces elasticus]
MTSSTSDAHVELDGINYFTLLEEPTDGNKDAPCILLIHALMSNLHMWDDTATALQKAGYRTLRYDHVGHNNTPPTKDKHASYHLDDLTRHAHQLVEARTGQPYVKALVGCSIGGSMAFRYASLFPNDVGGIISIASPGLKSPEAAQKLWSERIEQFEEDLKTGESKLCQMTVKRWVPSERPEDDDARKLALQHVKTCSLPGYKVMADSIRGYDYSSMVEEIGKVKMLVVAGDEDQAGRADVLEEVASKIPGAEFVVMKQTGHLPPLQKADAFNEFMLQFLRSWP